MKKKIMQVVFAFILISNQSTGQINYFNYLDSTSRWNIYMTGGYFSMPCNDFIIVYSYIDHYFSGDTLLGNTWYYKLYSFRKDSSVCSSTLATTVGTATQFTAGIREDSLKRFYVNQGFGETLLWDFNISVGDTVNITCPVGSIDTFMLGMLPRKIFCCNCFQRSFILEGIGATTSFLSPYFCSLMFEGSSKLVSYRKQNDLIILDSLHQCTYVQSAFDLSGYEFPRITISPNPATNEITVQSSQFKIESVEVYDVVGKKCQSLVVSSQLSAQQLTTDYEPLTLDISQLAPGLYFVKMKTKEGARAAKFVKQ